MNTNAERRSLLKLALWSGLGVVAAGGVAAFGRFLYPRPTGEDANRFVVFKDELPAPGSPPLAHERGRFYLVNLMQGEGQDAREEPGPGGLLAFSWRCTHLNCRVRWEADYEWKNVRPDAPEEPGAFACRCHGSFFTKCGLVMQGPAARPLDTPALRLLEGGHAEVNMERITRGGPDNLRRTVLY